MKMLIMLNPTAQPKIKASTNAELIENICLYIQSHLNIHKTEPSLHTLAREFNLNENYLQKTFKSFTGITPKSYAQSLKERKIKSLLAKKQDITSSIYEAGYQSNSRFYEKSQSILGMTATDYKSGGDKQTIYFSIGLCFLGSVLMAQSEKGVCAITLGNDPEALLENLQHQFPNAQLIGGNKQFESTTAAILHYIDNPLSTRPDFSLDIQGTVFQRLVWEALLSVPVGHTITYQELASKIGKPRAVRAVASAVGANNLAVIIPCHRVVRLDKTPSGYRWGLEKKTAILEQEKTITQK